MLSTTLEAPEGSYRPLCPSPESTSAVQLFQFLCRSLKFLTLVAFMFWVKWKLEVSTVWKDGLQPLCIHPIMPIWSYQTATLLTWFASSVHTWGTSWKIVFIRSDAEFGFLTATLHKMLKVNQNQFVSKTQWVQHYSCLHILWCVLFWE